MDNDALASVVAWFDCFVATFAAQTPDEQRNYDLKTEHTGRVRAIIERLAASVHLPAAERSLAAIIAICHDVGRFPQYRQYGTFNDATSVNHAALSVRTLKEAGILECLAAESSALVLQSIALHNVFTLPPDLDPSSRLFAMLIRDADKLDIWRVLIEYCTSAPQERASAVVWELPDTGCCSQRALDEVISGRMINRSLLASADDFKLLQLSWAYDLNIAESFRILVERGYLDTLAALLPEQPGCLEAVSAVNKFVSTKTTPL